MIIERLPTAIADFLREVESLGFVLTLVGGGPRDLIFADSLGKDLDFEIRANREVETAQWPLYYQRLLEFLKQKKTSFKVLPYLITRVEIDAFKLEFSSPRIEKSLEENFTHHHFEATLDSRLDYKLSFKRRDFTINAIGLKLNMQQMRDEIVDPWNGVDDLKNGLMRAISEDFTHDSVRFLRLVRFQIKFNRFVMAPELIASLKQFNLTKLSVHHFKEEMFKSIPGKFLNLFNKLINQHHLAVSNEFNWIKEFTFHPELMTKEEILGFVFLQNKSAAEKVSAFFNLPAKCLKDLQSFIQSWENLSLISVSTLQMMAAKDYAETLTDSFFKDCRNIDEKKIWIKHLRLTSHHSSYDSFCDPFWDLPFGPEDWASITLSAEEKNAVAPAQRSYLIYVVALKRKYTHG